MMSESKSLIFMVLSGLAVVMAPTQSDAYQEVILAQWDFDSGAFTADSSGNGYTLASMGNPVQSTDVPPGIGSTGSAYFNRDDGGSDMLYTTVDLPLSSYDIIKVSWWQKIDPDCAPSILLETARTSYPADPRGIGVIVNSSTPGDGSNAYAVMKGGGYTVRNTFVHGDGWEKYTVWYDPESEDIYRQIVVYNEDGDIVDELPIWDGDSITFDPELPFVDFAMHLGARGDHVDAPYNGINGYLDSVEVVGISTGAMPGDANHDGAVDVSDLGILATYYDSGSGLTWEQGDFTADGFVDVSDLGILATNYGTTSEPQSVPEPSTAIMLVFTGLALIALKTKKRTQHGRA